jgi:hypothetical protein
MHGQRRTISTDRLTSFSPSVRRFDYADPVAQSPEMDQLMPAKQTRTQTSIVQSSVIFDLDQERSIWEMP